MEKEEKLRISKEYEKLTDELKEQIKLVYPQGYSRFLIPFINKEGKKAKALRFETEDKIYLIRMTIAEAEGIISMDDDFDDDGILKEGIKEEYEDKYADLDYLSDNENYDD